MTRYQALRRIGCGCLAASVIALLNRLMEVPAGQIRFMNITVDYDIKDTP